MTQPSLPTRPGGLRVFSACLLSALLIMMPFVQMAAVTRANARVSEVRSPESGKSEASVAENVYVDPALPGPVAVPLAPTITATMTDAIINDGVGGDPVDGKADPFNGTLGNSEKIEYTATISNTGSTASSVVFNATVDAHTTLVPGSVNASPLARDDSYETLGNTLLEVGVAASGNPAVRVTDATKDSVFDNDTEFLGDTFSFDTITVNPTKGTVNFNTDGTFSYQPNAGQTGTDTFTYRIKDGNGLTDTAVVTININAAEVWYVKNNVAGAGTGTSSDPFKTLLQAQTASGTGDTVYVDHGDNTTTGQNAGFLMKAGQRLIGEGVQLDVPVALNGGPSTTVLRAAGVRPMIDNVAGNGVTALNITIGQIRGLNIGALDSAIDISTTGVNSGGGEVADNVIRSSGSNGMDIFSNSTGTLTVSIHDNNVTSTGNGINILRSNGTLFVTAFDDNDVTGANTGVGISVTGGAGAANAVRFDANTGTTAYEAVSLGTTIIGAAGAGNGTGGAGLVLSSVRGDLTFNDLDIFTDNGTALFLLGTDPAFNAGTGTGTRFTGAGTPTLTAVGGAAADITDANINLVPTTMSSTNSVGAGVSLLRTGGTFTAPSGSSITNATGTDFNINGGSNASANVNVTYPGTITDDQGALVTITNVTASSTHTFSGLISDGFDGDGNGISLSGNTGANTTFSGGLNISTGANAAFSSTTAGNTGTLTITDPAGPTANKLQTTTGTALNVANTNIGASGLTFESITSNGSGTANGIILDTTGSSGGLTVTGTGGTCTSAATCTGGTISNKTGANGSTTQGTGIYLNNTKNPSFTRMQLNDFQNYAIQATSVDGFTLQNSIISGANGNDSAFDEGSVLFLNSKGTITISSCDIKGGLDDNLRSTYDSATALTATYNITGTSFHDLQNINGNAQVNLRTFTTASASSNVTWNFTSNCVFENDANNNPSPPPATQWWSDGILTTLEGPFQHTVNIQNATFHHLFNALDMANGFSADINYTIKNNTFTFTESNTINMGSATTATASSLATVLIQGNTIGNPGTTAADHNSGSRLGIGISQTWRGLDTAQVTIHGNTIQHTEVTGMDLFGQINNGLFSLQVTSNTVKQPDDDEGGGFGVVQGMRIEAQTPHDICLDISGNNSTGSGGGFGIETLQQTSSTFQLEGFSGTGTSAASVESFLASQNPLTSTVHVRTGGTGTIVQYTGGSCTTPATAMYRPETNRRDYFAQNDSLQKSNDSVLSFLNNRTDFSTVIEAMARGGESEASVNATAQLINTNTGSAAASAGVDLVVAPIKHAYPSDSYKPATADAESAPVAAKSEARTTIASVRNTKREVRSHHANTAQARGQRSEVRSHHAKSTRAMAAPLSGEAVGPLSLGTLQNGDTVIIKFQVTVNNPPDLNNPVNPLVVTQPAVATQGSVSYNDGATSQTPVLTDEVAGGAVTATETPVDLFDVSNTLASNLNPSNFGDLVTFTATIAETPAQPSVNPTGTVDFIDTSNANAVICDNVMLTVGLTAQCQTALLTSGTHNIRADYSGDGNFDAKQSNVVAQVVIPCVTNPVVDIVADEDDADCVTGDCSLREAIKNVCSGTTITFATGAGQAFQNAATITLSTSFGNLTIDRNMTIRAPAHGVTVVGSGNASHRVFVVNASKTATITNMTITGGNSDTIGGGGIKNDGTLTLKNSTVSGNATTQNGAGIHNSSVLNVVNSTISGNTSLIDGGGIVQDGASPTLYMVNSTVSGNTANGFAGGLDLRNGTVTILNSTVTGNHSDNDTDTNGGAGGIRQQTATVTIRNTIVAGNYKGSGTTTANDIEGTVSGNNNLIGDAGTAGGFTNSVNGNIVGAAIVSVLDTVLANHGGLTNTHRLITGSPALDAGENASLPTDTFDADGDANTGEALDVDQRGVGYPRVADSSDAANTTDTVDIGAFEAHPDIENIPAKSTAEDTAFNFNFNIGDDSAGLITSVTASSSNPTLAPDVNLIETDGTANDGVWNLQITPGTNANGPADGTATITVMVTASNGRTTSDTFVLTVTEVNDAPVPTNDVVTDIGEDCSSGCTAGKYVIPLATLLGNDTNKGAPNESGQPLNITAVSSPTGGTVAINGTDIEFTPTADFSGAAGFTYTATDDGTTNGASNPQSGNATVSFNITAVDDALTAGNNTGITVNEGSTGNTITNSMLSVNDADTSPGQLTYTVGTAPVNGTLKNNGGALASGGTFTQADIDGNLITYDHDGSETTGDSFTFTVSDGTTSIGPFTFNITVTPVNDVPIVTAGGTLNYTENDAATAIDTSIIVTDQDSANLASATAQITANYVNGQDVLSFVDTPNITGVFNAGDGTLTLTGSDSVANYQAALRAVMYHNTSENPSASARTVSWIVNDGTNPSSAATSTINVTSANDGPVNTVPGPQGTAQNTALVFSSGNGNPISVADADAGASTIQVTLTGSNGTLTLSGTSGLSFAFADGNGTGTGDGTADATMTFRGSLTDLNNALNGMSFTPTAGYSGAASVTITSNDLGNTGTGGPLTATDVVNITVSSNVSVNDGSAAEPSSGTGTMLFTVTLNSPAPAGGVSVQYATADGGGNPATGGASCGTPGVDYESVAPTTLTFLQNEQFKTISVTICSDAANDPNETFFVNLSNATNTTITDGQATGTITANTAGTVLISELRTYGPGGDGDEFVEIYNNSDSSLTVAASDISAGYGLYTMGADCNAAPVLLGVIPNGTVIPARGHYLLGGSAYSLTNYGGSGAAAVNLTLSGNIPVDGNVGLFSTSDVTLVSTVNRLDAVGFGTNVGGTCNLLREGSTLPSVAGNATTEHSFFRKMCDWQPGAGCTVAGNPKDTNVNADDFWLADTMATNFGTSRRLGAPGPENMASPVRRDTTGVNMVLLDGSVSSAANPNRSRNFTSDPLNNSSFGTMTIRRRVINNTGGNVTRLRYRIVDLSTLPSPPGTADLRARTGVTEASVGPIHDTATCTASGAGSPPCNVTVQATTLETPPAQAIGGGYNSTLSSGTIALGSPLANGASINVNFLLGIQQTGTFRFYIIIEALP